MTELTCGSLHRVPVAAIADRAARSILAYASPRAVTIDPQGRVFVEAPTTAAECDLLGVYHRSAGLLGLSRLLLEDLRHERTQRRGAL